MNEALAVSTAAVALGEIGDKTQLLALLLAARFRRPLPIIAGIAVATLANHAAAGAVGAQLARVIDPQWMRWLLGSSFIAAALRLLVPDQADDGPKASHGRLGVFGNTTAAFFLTEMGDKTQIATVMLAARYGALTAVVVGTTAGMLMANVPAVVFGEALVKRLPAAPVHRIAAILFAAVGVAVSAGVGLSCAARSATLP
jgi:putative Ca2+/H+ antiporter (TMEM165/GDT1 family)